MPRHSSRICASLAGLTSWSDFRGQLRGLDTKAKGDAFELVVKLFLTLDPKYRTQLRHVWNVGAGEVPREVSSHLRLPDLDEGIDLVAETGDGNYWAVQCKYREDEDHSLTVRELATFTSLAFGHCRGFDLGLVCTTSDRSSHRLKKYSERLAFQTGDVWRSLGPEFFDAARKHLAGRQGKLVPKRPRRHQSVAIGAANFHFVAGGNARGKLIMPCGTGKSLTAFWIADRLGARKILVAVPSLALVRQTLDVWSKEFVAHRQTPNWIAVCSDESVGDVSRDDAAVVLGDLGVRVHTDPREIASWLEQHRNGDLTVVFTTYQSGKATAAAARRAGFVFDLGIMDEAHKTVGRDDSTFSHLLHDENVRIARRVFMTATERYFKGSATRDDIASMDDVTLYGETFHQLSFKAAIEQKPSILSDYTVLTIVVKRGEVRRLIEDRHFVRPKGENWNIETEARTFAAAVALRRAMQEHPIRHAVSFHGSVKRARDFALLQEQFTKGIEGVTPIASCHVSGAMPTALRERQLAEFVAAKQALVTNARCLTEGVDVPMIDGILFADPRQSRIDIVQAVGRALRPVTGKKRGYVVVPVLLEDDAKGDAATESAYAQILDVLGALAANDERVVEYLRTISQGKRWTGPPIIEAELPVGLDIDASEFARAIELRAWQRLASLSWKPFEEARRFVRSRGLRSQAAWIQACAAGQIPRDIPKAPEYLYRNKGWTGYGDWLGTGRIADQEKTYRSFTSAREFARSLGLASKEEWFQYCRTGKKPDDIPTAPRNTYRNSGWQGFGDWLGTGRRCGQGWRDFAKARKFVRALKLRGREEWNEYCKSGKKPFDIPAGPKAAYAGLGWRDWGDWLGTGRHKGSMWRPFEEARAYVQTLGLNSVSWREYCASGRRPKDIPANPETVYEGKGWRDWRDWLGRARRMWRPFKEARAYVQSLGLTSAASWQQYCASGRRPKDIPSRPYETYRRKGWRGWRDWLGTARVSGTRRRVA